MIVLRKEVLRDWLKVTKRNQNWLAHEMGYTKGYISQVMNDECKISAGFIERILIVTKIQFGDMFYFDGRPDTRENYGEVFVFEGQNFNKRRFFEEIRSSPGYIKNN